MTGSYDWIAWTAGGLVGLLGVCLALWALLIDGYRRRWHKQRRCPKCWYDMRHTPGATCSECGFTDKREHQLFKARRRWRWVAVAVLLMGIGWGGGAYPKIKRDGWRSVVPTTVLIAALPWLDEPRWVARPAPMPFIGAGPTLRPMSFCAELGRRAMNDSLWDWQWQWLIDRACTGDAARRPPSTLWGNVYARFLRSAKTNGHLDGSGWEEKLVPALLSVDIALREHWPADVPVVRWRYRVTADPTLQSLLGNFSALWITPQDPSRGSSEHRSGGMRAWPVPSNRLLRNPQIWNGPCDETSSELGVLPPGRTHIGFDITIERVDVGTATALCVWSTAVREPIEIAETTEDVLIPIESTTVSEAIRSSIEFDVWAPIPDSIGFRPALTELADLAPITFSVAIEYVLGDEVLFSTSVWWDVQPADSEGEVSATRVLGLYDVLLRDSLARRIAARAQESRDAASLQIRSDPVVALRNFDCDRYWVGEVTIPLEWIDGRWFVPDQDEGDASGPVMDGG
ncbi:MAG: hypothetical protein KAS72_00965 [Phycisphaerales bacterium]|nr:hypothetical protein [Phycisphaerales bacterium]